LELQAAIIGSACVSIARSLPPSAIVISRTLGLGREQTESRSTVQAVLDAYRKAGVNTRFCTRHRHTQTNNLRCRFMTFVSGPPTRP
jgi:hypothetical protein